MRGRDNQNFRALVLQKSTTAGNNVSSNKRQKISKSKALAILDDEDKHENITQLILQTDRQEAQRKKRAVKRQQQLEESGAARDNDADVDIIWRKGKKIRVKRKQQGLMRIPRAEGDDESTYIDRAALRRKDEGVIADEFEKQRALNARDSKYMGGDLEHTHWVKGLDYMLLQKIRTELEADTDSSLPASHFENLVKDAANRPSKYSSIHCYLANYHNILEPDDSMPVMKRNYKRKVTYEISIRPSPNELTDIPEQYLSSRSNNIAAPETTSDPISDETMKMLKFSFDWIRENQKLGDAKLFFRPEGQTGIPEPTAETHEDNYDMFV